MPDIKPKLFLEDIESVIETEDYYHFPGTTVTVCCLKLKNGFAVIGESGCINGAEFDIEKGKKFARHRAISKVWDLEGYLLKTIHKEYGVYQEITS